ncbi:putative Hydroxyproline-rich glycoprotein family protein [Melia azedarach]|uniref:Hydroxyproline-rich glycoprotein family protein n=1 Tax=Melia azedarach TaxID=155640 RepID=A0ACC1Y054_MELAZ|nr:putative Hydroxyproline-rich glycoprotein family protein [Melia azedarach]
MGKNEQNLHQQQTHQTPNPGSSSFFCQRCSMVLSVISREFSPKCVVFLFLGIAVFLCGIFWIIPLQKIQSGFDAKDAIKLSASVQASFRLQKPVSELVPRIGTLEYDVYGEIGVPDTKVAILSMHQSDASNWTDVVFGVISDPINVPINPVSLSVLRSSLIELFLRESNLTLTTTVFGEPSTFEILKFPGGITVIPLQIASIWQMPQILFNFSLNNSISEIEENFIELRDELKFGLHLRPYENVYVQITNKDGSTISSPVTVQASVMSDMGSLLPQRLKQLAQIIADFRAKNLGLDNSVFGKVNGVVLSSYLKGTLQATPPTPSPSPSSEPPIPPYPATSPYAPAPSPNSYCHRPGFHYRTSPCTNNQPHTPSSQSGPSLAPSSATALPPCSCPCPCPYCHRCTVRPSCSPASNPNPTRSHPTGLPKLAPDMAPLPVIAYHSRPDQDVGSAAAPTSSSLPPSLSSLAVCLCYKVRLMGFSRLLIFHILFW